MILTRRYRISASYLRELEQLGLPANLVRALRAHISQRVYRKNALMELLNNLNPQPSERERRVIAQICRLGLLRLEALMPNRGMREWIEALILAVLIAIFVRTFVFAPFKIPSGSMIPTISKGDHLFASLYSYRIPVPFSTIRLWTRPVQRGDVVIFPYPVDPSVYYIKRVIALGGETITVRGTKVLINGKVLEEPYAYHDPAQVQQLRKAGRLPEYGPHRVPPGSLFMMGDNRLNSQDSRVWGFLSERSVVGRAQIVYWSHDPQAGLFSGYALGRIGTVVR